MAGLTRRPACLAGGERPDTTLYVICGPYRLPFPYRTGCPDRGCPAASWWNFSCCALVNVVHNHLLWAPSRKEGMAWYSSRPLPSLWWWPARSHLSCLFFLLLACVCLDTISLCHLIRWRHVETGGGGVGRCIWTPFLEDSGTAFSHKTMTSDSSILGFFQLQRLMARRPILIVGAVTGEGAWFVQWWKLQKACRTSCSGKGCSATSHLQLRNIAFELKQLSPLKIMHGLWLVRSVF
jgi:hypothetical protein